MTFFFSESQFHLCPIGLKIFNLTSSVTSITAASNDVSFVSAFNILLSRRGKSGDLVLVVSASGNSENLIEAVEFAKSIQMKTFALLGFDGGNLKLMCDEYVLVESPIGEYGPVEDLHLAFCHAVTEQVKFEVQQERA